MRPSSVCGVLIMSDGGVAVTMSDGDGTRPGGARDIMPVSREAPNSFKVIMLYPGGKPQAVSDAPAVIIISIIHLASNPLPEVLALYSRRLLPSCL